VLVEHPEPDRTSPSSLQEPGLMDVGENSAVARVALTALVGR
jgi:hypothetical protein